ncbi:MAG: AsmA family protein [Mucilaginibacter sp.]|uniref:AsmA family protein n=1 Tax=Mucilaginibacter sp. TaxID=1882438 RepID=UPI0034E3F0A5
MPRWLKTILKIVAVVAGLLLLALVGASVYVNFHKAKILNAITKELNKNLRGGSLTVASMEPAFLSGFPGVSVSLQNVVLRDSLWKIHHHTLLEAKDFDITVNPFALLVGTIEINKIGINQATIYLYTDSTGYSNTFVLKKKDETKANSKKVSSTAPEIRKFTLSQVNFVLDNQKGHKLFHFSVEDLKGKMDYPGDDWNADINLKVLANDLSFNTNRGSFIKNKMVEGTIAANYQAATGVITVEPNMLNIGGDPFTIGANFSTIKNAGNFTISIATNGILWRRASALLAANIAKHLDMFDLKNPIAASCMLSGNFSGGDLAVNVNTSVKNNTLTTPGGTIDSCSFVGLYTNEYVKGKGLTDQNSAIKLYHLTGNYEQVPFTVDTGIISNLEKPIATGTFRSKFAVNRLNHLFDETLNFSRGTADLKFNYKADIVNFKLVKPVVSGYINIQNADANYVPRKLVFKNTSISLNITGNDLFLKNIHLQSGKSIVFMEGSVRNFMNLYYTDPEKILVNWQIRSPQMYLGEFLGFLSDKRSIRLKKKKSSSNFADQLNTVLEKGKADMHIRVDKAYYYKFLATDVIADLLLSEDGIQLKNVSVKNAGGSVNLNGTISQNGATNHFAINTNVNNVNISNFFYSFDNFGIQGFNYKNLRGFLSLKSNISGNVTDQGKVVPRSINGTVNLNLKKGALIDFDPIVNVGKFAFPFRDVRNIMIDNLNGKFDLHGDKITINPMMINSSVLNMNVAGVYGFTKGTNIALDVPLRNPKKDEDITNQQEKQDRRMKGIVLHILASDGDNGKIKFGWNKNHD